MSFASTVVLGVSASGQGSVGRTVAFVALAVAAICAMAARKRLDRWICAGIGQVLTRLGCFHEQDHPVLLEQPNGDQVSEYEIKSACSISALTAAGDGATCLPLNGAQVTPGADFLAPGDRLVCYAARPANRSLLAAISGAVPFVPRGPSNQDKTGKQGGPGHAATRPQPKLRPIDRTI